MQDSIYFTIGIVYFTVGLIYYINIQDQDIKQKSKQNKNKLKY